MTIGIGMMLAVVTHQAFVCLVSEPVLHGDEAAHANVAAAGVTLEHSTACTNYALTRVHWRFREDDWRGHLEVRSFREIGARVRGFSA